ncbi:hypothetical protein Tco_0581358 [Tanacetum coccineum]
MTSLAKHMIVAGAENRPPMLDKSMYNSWQSRMLLYINGKKTLYAYLSQHEGYANEARLMCERYPDPFALVANHQTQSHSTHHPTPSVPQNAYHYPPISPQPQAEFLLLDSGLVVSVFLPGDDLNACVNKAMAFMSTVVASCFPSTNNQLRTSSNPRNQATIQDGGVIVQQVQGRQCQSFAGQATDAYDSDRDDISFAKPVLMANLSSYGSDVLSEVPHSVTYQNDRINQSVQEMQYFEQTSIVDYPNNEITSDSNIIPYSQYLQKTQHEIVQDTNSSAQQDSMIIYMIEQMSEQMSNHVTN